MLCDFLLVGRGLKRLLPRIGSPLEIKCDKFERLIEPLSGLIDKPSTAGKFTTIYFDHKRSQREITQKRSFSISNRLLLLSDDDLIKAQKMKSERIQQSVEISKNKLKSRAKERRVPSSRIERVAHFGTGKG